MSDLAFLLHYLSFALCFIAAWISVYYGPWDQGTFFLVCACISAVWLSAEKRKGKA